MIYQFQILKYKPKDLKDLLRLVWTSTTGRFKINISFGFILKKKHTEELRFYHSSNTTFLLERPKLIANEIDFNNLVEEMEGRECSIKKVYLLHSFLQHSKKHILLAYKTLHVLDNKVKIIILIIWWLSELRLKSMYHKIATTLYHKMVEKWLKNGGKWLVDGWL